MPMQPLCAMTGSKFEAGYRGAQERHTDNPREFKLKDDPRNSSRVYGVHPSFYSFMTCFDLLLLEKSLAMDTLKPAFHIQHGELCSSFPVSFVSA